MERHDAGDNEHASTTQPSSSRVWCRGQVVECSWYRSWQKSNMAYRMNGGGAVAEKKEGGENTRGAVWRMRAARKCGSLSARHHATTSYRWGQGVWAAWW